MNLVQRGSNHAESRSCNLIYAEDGTLFHTQKRECSANESILKKELKRVLQRDPFYICVECALYLLKPPVQRSSSPLLHFLL